MKKTGYIRNSKLFVKRYETFKIFVYSAFEVK